MRFVWSGRWDSGALIFQMWVRPCLLVCLPFTTAYYYCWGWWFIVLTWPLCFLKKIYSFKGFFGSNIKIPYVFLKYSQFKHFKNWISFSLVSWILRNIYSHNLPLKFSLVADVDRNFQNLTRGQEENNCIQQLRLRRIKAHNTSTRVGHLQLGV